MAADEEIRAGVEQALAEVEDPELPVSIADLGMVRAVTVSGGEVAVHLVPTFLACPGLWLVEEQVRRSVGSVPGASGCEVRWLAGGWSGADVSPAGRVALAAAGVAAPAADGTAACPFCGSGEVSETSPFGSAVCRSAAYCQACQTPFEILKVKPVRAARQAPAPEGTAQR